MKPRLLLVSGRTDESATPGSFPPGVLRPDGWDVQGQNLSASVPDAAELCRYGLVIAFGPFADEARAVQFAGACRAALAAGVHVAVMTSSLITGIEVAAIKRMGVDLDIEVMETGQTPKAAATPFGSFMTEYGNAQTILMIDGAETLATNVDNEPVSLACPVGSGVAYVVPHYARVHAVRAALSLAAAIIAHDEHRGDEALPGFLRDESTMSGLLLHGEDAAIARVRTLQADLDSALEAAADLARWRNLIGVLSGSPYEALVRDALDLVLEGAGLHTEDDADLGRQDFWLVDAAATKVGLGEVKAENRHVRLDDIGQVNFHRSRAERPSSFPGLLVANVFRGAQGLDQRRSPVHPDIVAEATRQRVLILRGWDLYRLVSRALAGRDATELVEALPRGGWLEVDGDEPTLHTAPGA